MERDAHYAAVGIATVALLAALAVFTIWLARLQFNNDYDVYDIVVNSMLKGAVGFVAAILVFMTGIGLFFFYRNEKPAETFKALTLPLNIALLAGMGIYFLFGMDDWKTILLLALSLFGLLANSQMLLRLWKSGPKLTGGALSHIGIALALIGILFSSGYSNVVSLNTSGTVYRKDFSTEMNRDNVLMWRHTPQRMGAYTITYQGPRLELKNGLGYISKDLLVQAGEPHLGILTDSAQVAGNWRKPGDTLQFYPENTYYQIDYADSTGQVFTLYPRAQVNPNMGLIASPDIRRFLGKDLYTHVTSIPSPDEEVKYSKPVPSVLHMGDTFFVGDRVAVLHKVQRVTSPYVLASLGPHDAAVEAVVHIFGPGGQVFTGRPIFMIRNREVGLLPDVVEDAGARLALAEVNPSNQTFTLSVETAKTDWVIMKAMEKPGINILWIGIVVMSIGFGISVFRRFGDTGKAKPRVEKRRVAERV